MADSVQTWSSAWNDFDNDGFLDAVIGASSFTDGGHKFMHNNGDGTFTDITAGSGWDVFPNQSIEYVSYDFNNDGWADVFTNGKIMFNNGDNTFTATSYSMNVGAVGDLNNDGFLDVQNGNTVYYSNTNSNNWTKLQLKGIESNSNGIGARVEIYGAWGKQIRDVQSGIGFRHMGTMNVHFGIGAATVIDSIIIRWPSGKIDLICNPAINTPMIQTEGMVELPVSDFAASATTVPEGTTVNFDDASTICPSAWSWSVNPTAGWIYANSTTNLSQNPDITFNNPGTYIVELTANNTNGQSVIAATVTIIVTSTAGLNDLTNDLIRIYPNPTDYLLNIEVLASTILNQIEIISMMGASVQTNVIDLKSIDVSNLETGSYLIILTTEDGTRLTSRFIKK
jgi:PKD repeat protein